MEKVFRFFAENYKIPLFLTFFVVLVGILGLNRLRRESFPPVDFARVKISTLYPGASPEEVEKMVTAKIEDEIRPISGVKDVTSVSQAGRSEINVRIDLDGVNTKDVMDDVQRAVQSVSNLPAGVLERPTFTRLNSKEIPIFELAVIGPNESRRRDVLADRLKESLEDVDGVSDVRLVGYNKREFQILLDRDRLERHHVGITEVLEAVRKRTQDIPAGYIRGDKEQFLVRVRGQVASAEEMADIIVRSSFEGGMVRVGDVATVRDGAEDPSVNALINGEQATLLVISKKENADIVRTVERLRGAIEDFRSRVPEGYRIAAYNDESLEVSRRLSIVVTNAVGGLILVMIVLLAFLPGTVGIFTAMSLPLSVIATVGFMPSLDANFNRITMLALVIAIGMLVDNAVVVGENYSRLRESGLERGDAAVKAVAQFWVPISATALTTIVAFLPMLVTKGIMGQFIRYIPIVVTLSLVMCLLEAFFLLPARLRFTLRGIRGGGAEIVSDSPRKSTEGGWFVRFRNAFEILMLRSVRRRYWVFGATTLMLFGSLALAVLGNRFELFPKEGVEIYVGRFEAPAGSTLKVTERLAMRLAADIREAIGDEKIRYQTLRAGVSQLGLNDPQAKNGDDVGMVMIYLKPEHAVKMEMRDVLTALRSISVDGFKTLAFSAAAGGPPVGDPLNVTFRGNNFEALNRMVERFKKEISVFEGVFDVDDDVIRGGPEYGLKLDHAMLARLNLSAEEVGMALRTALQGAVASELNLDNEEFYLRIRYDEKNRETVEALKSTRILERSGKLIPLSAVATLQKTEGPTVRKHFNYRRAVTVTADVNPQKITSIQINKKAQEIIQGMASEFPGVSWVFGGEGESTKESIESLRNAMLLAIVGIFAIMLFMFKSYLKAFLVLSTVPLGLVGVSVAFFLHDKPLGFFAMIGVVGLAGVVVNSAIVLISYIETLRAEDPGRSLDEVLAQASAFRLRAVMATSLTTVGGLMPTAYSIGGYDPVLVPMTLAMAWGLVSGTVLTLVWIPAAYGIIEDFGRLKLARLVPARLRGPGAEAGVQSA